jgi:DNA-binding PadR family transcriptional regulator
MTNGELQELGRFAEPSLYILVSLGDGPKHGYAIMTDVEGISGVPLGPGTLYAALARLERRGLIEALEAEDRRRPYRLTGLGVATLRARLEQLEGFTRTGLRRLRSDET